MEGSLSVTLDELLDIIQRTPGRAAINLRPEQRKIVETSEGPLWVIAGPGSGKTEILVLRCLRLIYVDRVDPRSMMVTTFTEKAARELEDRLGDYAAWITESAPKEEVEDVDITHVRVGTLHSICNDVLLEYRYPAYQNVRLMDGLEQLVFINEHSELARTKPGASSPERQLWIEFVGLMGGWPNQSATTRMRWPPNRAKGVRNLVGRIVEYRVDVARLRSAGGHWTCLAGGYEDYVSKLRELRRSDFSHVQQTFLGFLGDPKGQLFTHGDGTENHPGISHVLVDEYQDTNPIQEAIYFKLTEREPHNLMVVGDDDQAIFRFRGGTVEALIYFDSSCEVRWGLSAGSVAPVPLYDNFRSHRRIVDWCNHYITAFPEMQAPRARAPGKQPLDSLSSINSDFGDYPSIAAISGPRVRDVARVFALTVEELISSGTVTDPSDCALLLRSVRETRNWAGPYVDALRSRGIETYNPRAKTFMDQQEVQASLGALLAILDPGLDACPSQVSRYPTQWSNAYQALRPSAPELEDYVTRARAQIASKGPRTLLGTGALELFYILLSLPPFSVWKEEDLERSERLAKLTRILEAYTSMPRAGTTERTRTLLGTSNEGHEVSRLWLSSFYWGLVSVLEQESLDDEEDEYEIFPRGRLPIMTIFQAKGLQFPFVFVATRENDQPNPSGAHIAEDLLFPFRRDSSSQPFDAATRAVQDFARLFYVAHSRAQHGLVILTTDRQRAEDAPHLGPRGYGWITGNGGPDLTLLPVSS